MNLEIHLNINFICIYFNIVWLKGLIVTVNIHEVMKESCQLAYRFAQYIASTFFNNTYL